MDVLFKSGLTFLLSTTLLGLWGCSTKQEPQATVPGSAQQTTQEMPDEEYRSVLDFAEFAPDLSTMSAMNTTESYRIEPQPVTPAPTVHPIDTTDNIDAVDVIDTVDKVVYLDQGGEFWDILYMGINPVGFQQTSFSHETLQDQPILRVQVYSQFNAPLFSSSLQQGQAGSELAVRSYETVSGELIGCQAKTVLDQVLTEHLAKVTENTLERTMVLGDNPAQTDTIPWKPGAGWGGFRAIQISLWKNPMEDKEERRVTFYDPVNQALVHSTLTAKDVEPITISGKIWSLRRIDAILKYSQRQYAFTFWVDAPGSIIRSLMVFPNGRCLTAIRTTEATAKNFSIAESLDE